MLVTPCPNNEEGIFSIVKCLIQIQNVCPLNKRILKSFISILIFCLPDKRGFQVPNWCVYSAPLPASPTGICNGHYSQPSSEWYSMQCNYIYLKRWSPTFLAKGIIALLAFKFTLLTQTRKVKVNKVCPPSPSTLIPNKRAIIIPCSVK